MSLHISPCFSRVNKVKSQFIFCVVELEKVHFRPPSLIISLLSLARFFYMASSTLHGFLTLRLSPHVNSNSLLALKLLKYWIIAMLLHGKTKTVLYQPCKRLSLQSPYMKHLTLLVCSPHSFFILKYVYISKVPVLSQNQRLKNLLFSKVQIISHWVDKN